MILSHRVALGLLLGGLSGCAAGPDSCSMALIATVPLQSMADDSKLGVSATLDHDPVTLIVDTGSQVTVLDRAIVHSGERSGDHGFIAGFGGSRAAVLAQLDELRIGTLHGSIPAVVTTLDPDLQHQGFAGLLGMDVMGAYDVDLDLPALQLRFFKSQGNCSDPHAVLTAPLYTVAELSHEPSDATAYLRITIAGQSFIAILDTGSPGTVISRAAARRLGLTDAILANDPIINGSGIGRRPVIGRLHRLGDVTLGDLTISGLNAVVLQESFNDRADLVLGLDIARRIHFWLSASSQQLIMQYPAAASPPPTP